VPETAKQRLIASIRRKALRAAKASSEARSQLEEVADALADDDVQQQSQQQQQPEEEPSKLRQQPLSDTEESEEDRADKNAIPYRDWLNLSAVAGQPVSVLKMRQGLDPYNCVIVVERIKPSLYRGKPVPVGLIPGCQFTFPFDLTKIEQEVAALYGGEQYILRLRNHLGKTLRTIPLTIAMAPKSIGGSMEGLEEEGEEEDERGNGPLVDLRRKVKEEKLTTDLLRERRNRLEAQREVSEVEPPENNGEEEESVSSAFGIDQEVQRRVQEAREELTQEYEVKAELARLRDEIRNRKTDDGGGNMNLIVTSMQTQTNAMLEGLKMVVTNVADQVKEMQRSSQMQAEIMARSQAVASDAQGKIMQAMMDAKGGQVELVMKLMGDRREREDLGIDRITNLIMTGMELKAGLAEKQGGGGGGDDWLNVAIKSLTDLITKKSLSEQSIPALPPPQQTVDEAAQRKLIEVEAQKAASRIVAKAKQDSLRRAAAAKAAQAVPGAVVVPAQSGAAPAGSTPATVPAAVLSTADGDAVEFPEDEGEGDTLEVEESPVSADPTARRRVLLSQVLTIILDEMDDMPLESEAIDYALNSMPAEWRQKIATTDNALAFMEFFKPYADISLVEKIRDKAKTSPKQQEWLMQQAGILRGAVVEAMQPPIGGAS
jgi:hypothetical protein